MGVDQIRKVVPEGPASRLKAKQKRRGGDWLCRLIHFVNSKRRTLSLPHTAGRSRRELYLWKRHSVTKTLRPEVPPNPSQNGTSASNLAAYFGALPKVSRQDRLNISKEILPTCLGPRRVGFR